MGQHRLRGRRPGRERGVPGEAARRHPGTLQPDQRAEGLQADLKAWAAEYAPVHQVAHWDDQQRREVPNYNRAFEAAAQHAETLLSRAGGEFGPRLLELYPAVIWEDQDECLEVQPEDIKYSA